jgi:hypothetical protein
MALVKWAGLSSRGSVLTTELNTLANNTFSALGTAYDNTANLDRWGWVELSLASLTPTAGACVYIYLVPSVDGTNYDNGPSSTNPATHLLVATLSIQTGAAAKVAVTQIPFSLPPSKFKFALKNQTGVAFGGTNTLDLFTSNESVA